MNNGKWEKDGESWRFVQNKKWRNQNTLSPEWRPNDSSARQGECQSEQGDQREQHSKARRAVRTKFWNWWVESLLLLFCRIDDFINIFIVALFVAPENREEKAKRCLIEEALKNPNTTIEQWREFAKSEYGLINGELHMLHHNATVFYHTWGACRWFASQCVASSPWRRSRAMRSRPNTEGVEQSPGV